MGGYHRVGPRSPIKGIDSQIEDVIDIDLGRREEGPSDEGLPPGRDINGDLPSLALEIAHNTRDLFTSPKKIGVLKDHTFRIRLKPEGLGDDLQAIHDGSDHLAVGLFCIDPNFVRAILPLIDHGIVGVEKGSGSAAQESDVGFQSDL